MYACLLNIQIWLNFLEITVILSIALMYFGYLKYKKLVYELNIFKNKPNEKPKHTDKISTIANPSATENLIDIYENATKAYKSGDFEKALELFINIYQSSPNNINLLCRIGRSLCNLDRNFEANEYFYKALIIDESSHEALTGLATSMRFIDLDKAISFCKKALDLEPKDVFLFDYLGLLYRDKNEINKSIECHNEAIRINPDNSVSYFYLCLLRARQEAHNDAVKSMQDCLQRVNSDTNLRMVWVQTIRVCNFILSGQIDLALKECAELTGLISGNKRAKKAVLSHITFLLNSKNLEKYNYKMIQIIENG